MPQHRVFDGNALIGRFDFAWPRNNPPVVLQAHGERYHANTEQWLRDMQQVSELNEIGWRVIQCSMSDVTRRPARLAQMIRRALAGYRGDGVYRDTHLRDPEVDSMAQRSARQRGL
jgi:very-short-patch-repair endonuclease